jgi:16S rRNA (uracil1498-N3)-methyltransferase
LTRVRAPVDDLATGERQLDARTARYLSGALRLREGDSFVAFDPKRGREADAVIVREERGAVVARVGALRDAKVTAERKVTWIQGLAKGDKMDGIVRDATELGATRLVPAVTAFSVVKLDDARGAARTLRWERIAREAARQCGRGDAPEVLRPCDWRAALASAGDEAARFCLYERAHEPLGPPLADALRKGAPLAFAAGPEGGLDEEEVGLARDAGWVIASLGTFVLRTETVAAAVLGAVRVLGTGGTDPSPLP